MEFTQTHEQTIALDIKIQNQKIICDYIEADFNGIIRFFTLLARNEERLQTLLGTTAVPDYKQWIITMWHIGRDSLTEYAGEKFSIAVEDAMHGLTRIYSKVFDTINGNNRGETRTRVRFETQQYPNTTVLRALQLDKVGVIT